MNLLRTLLNACRSWRRRPGGPRTRKRSDIRMEPLDHRRLLAVNFTGNAILDIPDTTAPGTVILQDSTVLPIRNPQLAELIKVSGFDINGIRMRYTPDDDVLSVAIQQPLNQKTDPQFPVIAGDADNNGNGGTVSPAVRQVQPLFMDFPNLGGSETMGIFIDLNNDGRPDVVAGVPNTPGAGKFFTVADAVVSSDPVEAMNTAPTFGTPLPSHTGYSFLRDTDREHGAFEFQITGFSALYKEKTGIDLRTDTIIQVGAFAGSNDDFIDEELVRAQPVNFGVVPPTPPPDVCPPLSPPVLINPHQHRHVNTAHPGYVRVSIFGTSGFDVNRILPESVRFGGAAPVAHFTRNIDRDEFLDVTYVFVGNQITLPPGQSLAHVTGLYNDAATGKVVEFDTAKIVFNKDLSSYGPGQIAAQQRRIAARGEAPNFPPAFVAQRARSRGVDLVIDQLQAESRAAWDPRGRPTVRIPAGAAQAARLAGHPVTVQAPTHHAAHGAAAGTHAGVVPNPAGGPTVAQHRAQKRLDQGGYLDDFASSLAS